MRHDREEEEEEEPSRRGSRVVPGLEFRV